MFANRAKAGHMLAQALAKYGMGGDRSDGRAVVLGIPRGGVVVAAEVARSLSLPLDVVVATKVSSPINPEYAVGAVAADGEVLANPSAGVAPEEVRRLSGPAHAKALHALSMFRAGLPPLDLEGRTAIVVDDGLATGLTAIAAVGYLRRVGAAGIVLAVPVASVSAAAALRPYVDELVVLETPPGFSAVGQFYATFGQTEDAEVVALLADAAGRTLS